MQGKAPKAAASKEVTGSSLIPSGHHPELTARDHDVLADLAAYRYLTTAQIARLRFGHLKLAQRRLRRLTDLELVARFQPSPLPRLGFRDWTYRLSPPGAALVARTLGSPLALVKPPIRVPRGETYLAHHRELTEFRIWLDEGCRASGGAFQVHLVPGYEEHRVDGRRRKRVAIPLPSSGGVVVPDAVFCLTRDDGRAALFMLEIDRGTEPFTGTHGNALEAKIRRYAEVFDGKAEEVFSRLFDRPFDGFRVLFVVPDRRRAEGTLRVTVDVGLDPLVWVAVCSDLVGKGDLAAQVWKDRPSGGGRSLIE